MGGRINYVCATCSETFTRKASGLRHNLNMHLGTADVVRLIDYLLGRISGQYMPSGPADFRLTKRQKDSVHKRKRNPQKTRVNKILDNINDHPLFKRVINEPQNRLGKAEERMPFLLDIKKNSGTSYTDNSSNEYENARVALATIEQMLTHFYSKEFAQRTLKTLISLSNVRGDYSPIHDALERHRRNIRNRFGYI